MSDRIIGVDLGGTRIRAACLDYDLNVLTRQETLTQAADGPDAVIARMIDLIRAIWPADDQVLGIGVSSPGPLDPVRGIVLAPPNLKGWQHVPLAGRLQAAFAVPVYIGKDTNVAVLAETARGAARGSQDVVYITLSTGIGAGVLNGGRLLLGHDGLATEVGSMWMLIDGQATRFEAAAAGPALARHAHERIAQGAESAMTALAQGDLDQLDTRIVGQAAQAGDALALEIVARAGYLIGLGVTSVLHLFNPEVLVIGGGVSNIGAPLMEPLRATIEQHVIYAGYLDHLQIKLAALGEDVSIIGGAALVRTQGGHVPLLE
jgi:glucokinase